ncbi:quorum threshold expression protein QteE [Pseudomonas aeruginosa]|nr:quorum threshold expression protein QteE [Pseudomonas aeruginosa]EKW2746808.1 quorum threshold expression protein QteE [Pseudomonas aeruginosa]EKW8551866.1 quorum threshold expression protein QteE [Pseudomonas aeruginosa]ELW9737698.1 quorum threshold expression protein QteE [Pseudomonas aeruginosa]EMA2708395.1 quorum threshold expression protein QteE [Pseudomonas aeruginosa]
MLIHFCPRLLTPAGFDLPCELIDIRIKEFDLHLLGGRDVVARHPLPDKRYHVACRKSGCKAVNGLLVDVEKHVPLFTVDTRWSIDAEVVLRHRVEYVVLDAEHDAVSDYMLLWCDEVPNYFLGQSTPAMQVPLMELMRGNALQTERQDMFRLPTLRSERLRQGNADANQHLPSREQAFHVKAEQISYGLA